MSSDIDAALADVVNRAKRAEFIDWLASGGLSDLGDEQLKKKAWMYR